MFTIKNTRNHYGTDLVSYHGTFDSVDSAVDAAVKVEAFATARDLYMDLDVVPIPDGVTPKVIAADYF